MRFYGYAVLRLCGFTEIAGIDTIYIIDIISIASISAILAISIKKAITAQPPNRKTVKPYHRQ